MQQEHSFRVICCSFVVSLPEFIFCFVVCVALNVVIRVYIDLSKSPNSKSPNSILNSPITGTNNSHLEGGLAGGVDCAERRGGGQQSKLL